MLHLRSLLATQGELLSGQWSPNQTADINGCPQSTDHQRCKGHQASGGEEEPAEGLLKFTFSGQGARLSAWVCVRAPWVGQIRLGLQSDMD